MAATCTHLYVENIGIGYNNNILVVKLKKPNFKFTTYIIAGEHAREV